MGFSSKCYDSMNFEGQKVSKNSIKLSVTAQGFGSHYVLSSNILGGTDIHGEHAHWPGPFS